TTHLHPFPTRRSSDLIITTRSANWPGGSGGSLPVQPLTREEAVTLLRRRTNRNDSADSAERLAKALGDLPLALDQAAAVIDQGRSEEHTSELQSLRHL